MSDFIQPGSPEWLRLITPSKVPSILGVSRFKSQYTLWHEMAGLIAPAPVSEQQQDDYDYGHAAEAAAAEYWKWKNEGWRLSRGEVQLRNAELPFAHLATIDRRGSRGRSRRVVEVKTARDLYEYGDDGSGETPIDYTVQVTTQQLISGWHDDADLVVWPQYGKPRIYKVPFNPQVAAAIVDRCVAWVDSLATGTPPDLDDSITCYETVRALHPDIDDVEVEVDRDLALQYLALDAERKEVEKAALGAKTKILAAMGRARYAVVDGRKIAGRRAGKHAVALYPNHKNYDLIQEHAA